MAKPQSVTPTALVVFCSQPERLALFYGSALALEIEERGEDFVCLVGNGIEVNLVRMNSKPGTVRVPEAEFALREETPIKASFLVDSFDRVREAVEMHGGGLFPEDKAWNWRGHRHLDGFDPEGNVVQFRVRWPALPRT